MDSSAFFSRQVIGPLEDGEVFNQDDFLLLESIILKTSGERIKNKIQQLGIEEDRYGVSRLVPGCRGQTSTPYAG